jgi:hypothetical protein
VFDRSLSVIARPSSSFIRASGTFSTLSAPSFSSSRIRAR